KSPSARMRSMSTEPTIPRQPTIPTFFTVMGFSHVQHRASSRWHRAHTAAAGFGNDKAAFYAVREKNPFLAGFADRASDRRGGTRADGERSGKGALARFLRAAIPDDSPFAYSGGLGWSV